MNTVISWLEEMSNHLDKDYDAIVPFVGDEGKGKSTLLMQCGYLWLDIIDHREQTVENAVDQIAWDLEEFKTAMGQSPRKSFISVHDAARVMSRKKAMHGDQVELEEDMFDVRFGNYFIGLGYQDFDTVPTVLAKRRSKNLIRIPERGVVHGHDEDNIRHRFYEDEWPDPVFRDTFPDLEGTKLWEAFVEEDQTRKRERIQEVGDGDDDVPEFTVDELVEEIKEDGLEHVVSIHGGHGKPYIDKDLIEYEYAVSGNKAKKAAKVLKREVDLMEAGL